MQSILGALLTAGYAAAVAAAIAAAPNQDKVTDIGGGAAAEVVRRREQVAQQLSEVRRPDHGGGQGVVPAGRIVGLHRRHRGHPARGALSSSCFPRRDEERAAARRLPRGGCRWTRPERPSRRRVTSSRTRTAAAAGPLRRLAARWCRRTATARSSCCSSSRTCVGVDDAAWGRSLVLLVQIGPCGWRCGSRARGAACACSRPRSSRSLGASPSANLVWGEGDLYDRPSSSTSAALYFIAPLSILRAIVLQRDVDHETVLGAIDAYLLIGMFFAFVYQAVGAIGRTRSSKEASRARSPSRCSSASRRSRRPATATSCPPGNPGRRSP